MGAEAVRWPGQGRPVATVTTCAGAGAITGVPTRSRSACVVRRAAATARGRDTRRLPGLDGRAGGRLVGRAASALVVPAGAQVDRGSRVHLRAVRGRLGGDARRTVAVRRGRVRGVRPVGARTARAGLGRGARPAAGARPGGAVAAVGRDRRRGVRRGGHLGRRRRTPAGPERSARTGAGGRRGHHGTDPGRGRRAPARPFPVPARPHGARARRAHRRHRGPVGHARRPAGAPGSWPSTWPGSP